MANSAKFQLNFNWIYTPVIFMNLFTSSLVNTLWVSMVTSLVSGIIPNNDIIDKFFLATLCTCSMKVWIEVAVFLLAKHTSQSCRYNRDYYKKLLGKSSEFYSLMPCRWHNSVKVCCYMHIRKIPIGQAIGGSFLVMNTRTAEHK